jgi:hypothetical protein
MGESEMKSINFLWTNGRDVHHPTDEPNPAHVESLGQGKARPNFFKPARRFGIKSMPPRMPHGMIECLGPTLVWSPWPGVDEIEWSYWAKFLEFKPSLNPAPSMKWDIIIPRGCTVLNMYEYTWVHRRGINLNTTVLRIHTINTFRTENIHIYLH